MTTPLEALRSVSALILETQLPAYSMRQEVVELMKILANSGTLRSARQADLSSGEIRTSNGLALAPGLAATCADDFVRTIEFIRGTQAAIGELRKQFPDRPVRVLYAGCGPYATLAIPLMVSFFPQEAVFTLLDIQPESIGSAKCVVEKLGLADHVAQYEMLDAGAYQLEPGQAPDLILLEMMQACLATEPQVAITRHLLSQAPHAILIPEEVSIDLVLVDPSREFDLAGPERTAGDLQRDRIPVASVFVLNRETVKAWENLQGNRLPGASARLPEAVEQGYQPMLFTNIRIYQEYVLKDYDSGLTCPRQFSSDVPIKAGDTISFHYELGRQPQLRSAARLDKLET